MFGIKVVAREEVERDLKKDAKRAKKDHKKAKKEEKKRRKHDDAS
eukprot:CAMPEP_0197595544 /NCGR_PEP_ID=MMETSP1326-20131121/23082_1 /TAXON_ID=1155430 /ORGANISM="Genus nov. species nov., Strain RCC2288" /LENGTH=44 /DNA_ID= /DNA_START= /DNA_END= /DNA_ORIENTATION=